MATTKEVTVEMVDETVSDKVDEYIDAKAAYFADEIVKKVALPDWIERLIHLVVNENRWIGNNAVTARRRVAPRALRRRRGFRERLERPRGNRVRRASLSER